MKKDASPQQQALFQAFLVDRSLLCIRCDCKCELTDCADYGNRTAALHDARSNPEMLFYAGADWIEECELGLDDEVIP